MFNRKMNYYFYQVGSDRKMHILSWLCLGDKICLSEFSTCVSWPSELPSATVSSLESLAAWLMSSPVPLTLCWANDGWFHSSHIAHLLIFFVLEMKCKLDGILIRASSLFPTMWRCRACKRCSCMRSWQQKRDKGFRQAQSATQQKRGEHGAKVSDFKMNS